MRKEINKDSAEEVFAAFKGLKTLVIGDVMIDSYLWGEVKRISPEAPVPVVNVKKREKRLGGAANVAMNAQALEAQPYLCSVIGQDEDGDQLIAMLEAQGLSTQGILQSEQRVTTVKHRILAGHQQLLRVDSERSHNMEDRDREQLLERVMDLMPEAEVIIFEDYDKGVLSPALIQPLVENANKRGIPTVVDPKYRNFMHYQGVTLFKPNLKELREGLKIDSLAKEPQALKAAVDQLRLSMPIEQALITLSEAGIYWDNGQEYLHLPAHIRRIADVSGAGDTVISVAALALALGLSPKQLAGLANLAGGLVCEDLGVVSINKEKLKKEAIQNGLFE